MFGFQQCFEAGELAAEFDLAEESGPISRLEGLVGDEVAILVPDHSRLICVSAIWAGGILATEMLWDRFLKEGLLLRRCLVPVTEFHVRGHGSKVLAGRPEDARPLALAGVLAWSSTFNLEVCVAATSHFAAPELEYAPLPVTPSYRLRWSRCSGSQDLINLMERPDSVQPVRVDTWNSQLQEPAPFASVKFAAYPAERELHFMPGPPMTGYFL